MQRKFHVERIVFSTNIAAIIEYLLGKKKKKTHHRQKLTQKWITDLNEKF